MTFRDIVEEMVREDSENWVQDLLMEFGNKDVSTAAEDIDFLNLGDHKEYTCKVVILNGFNIPVASVLVSGKVGRHIQHIAVRHDYKLVWHESSFIREDMEIKEFRI